MLGQDLTVVMREVLREALPDVEIHALDRSRLNVTDLDAVVKVVRDLHPWAVVNCAAYTNVDKAETEVAAAMATNALGPRNLAVACEETGAWLMHFSTDYIFDGSKAGPYGIWDEPNPVNQYGRSKLWGERYAASLCRRYFILRTSWLFGRHGRNFVQTMLGLGKGDAPLQVVNDQAGAPTYTIDFARAAASLLETGAFGIYHVTNSGLTTWYGFAVEIMRKSGLRKEILPVSTEEFPRPARRPRNSALDPYPLKETIGHLLPDWQNALDRYLREQK